MTDAEIYTAARSHRPTIDKASEVEPDWQADRIDQLAGHSLSKHRPKHRHEGQPCDEAELFNTPKWMRGDGDPVNLFDGSLRNGSMRSDAASDIPTHDGRTRADVRAHTSNR